jgi:hypothetical protein
VGTSKFGAALILFWLYGWAVVFLICPARTFRLLVFGRTPTARNLRSMRMVGVMAAAFGGYLSFQFATGAIPIR